MLFNIKNILVPVDYSEQSADALAFALKIAKLTSCSISLVHVIDKPADFTFQDKATKEYVLQNEEQRITELAENIEGDGTGITYFVRVGNIITSIQKLSRAFEYDLIVTGTKGATGLKSKLFGSVTSGLILNSEIPVLAIPGPLADKSIDHIVFTSDYHKEDLEMLKSTVDLAAFFNAKVAVIHIATEGNFEEEIKFRGFQEMASEHIAYASLNFRFIEASDFYKGLSDFLKEEPAQLIALAKYKKTFFRSLREDSYTKQLSLYSKIPLLVFPGNEPT